MPGKLGIVFFVMPAPQPGKLLDLLYCPFYRPSVCSHRRIEHRGGDAKDYWIHDVALNKQWGIPENSAIYHGEPGEQDFAIKLLENSKWQETAATNLGLRNLPGGIRGCYLVKRVRVLTKNRAAADAAAERRILAEKEAGE